MSDEGLRQVLARHGYRLRFREHEWAECLIACPTEAFEGRGLDRAAALEDALSRAFPSRIARELFDVAVAAASRTVPQPVVSRPVAVEAAKDDPTPVDTEDVAEPARPPSEASAPREAPRPAVIRTLDRSSGRVPPPSPTRAAPLLVRADAGRRPADRRRSIEDLSILSDRIEDSRPELAWSTAPRQRLAILAWICEARSHTDVFPEDPEIRDAVARVSRQLTEIGKAYWPGSVTALQLQMQPTDLPKHLLGGTPATWARAAELAERALANLEHADERRGQDIYGWADAAALIPPPRDPKTILERLVSAVEASWGPLDRFAEPRNPEDLPEPALYRRWVRELRWIRGQDIDPDEWARVMGRLRWWACRRNGPVQAEGRELEPAFKPDRPWRELLDGAAAPANEVELPRDLIDRVRGRFDGKRLLCVGSRRDPEEQARLTAALPDTELDWRFAEQSLLESLTVTLERGNYDAVLAAMGLQAQAADLALARGCRTVGVRYVRVNRGQSVACLRALARAS
jgi:hypothetical protein